MDLITGMAICFSVLCITMCIDSVVSTIYNSTKNENK